MSFCVYICTVRLYCYVSVCPADSECVYLSIDTHTLSLLTPSGYHSQRAFWHFQTAVLQSPQDSLVGPVQLCVPPHFKPHEANAVNHSQQPTTSASYRLSTASLAFPGRPRHSPGLHVLHVIISLPYTTTSLFPYSTQRWRSLSVIICFVLHYIDRFVFCLYLTWRSRKCQTSHLTYCDF